MISLLEVQKIIDKIRLGENPLDGFMEGDIIELLEILAENKKYYQFLFLGIYVFNYREDIIEYMIQHNIKSKRSYLIGTNKFILNLIFLRKLNPIIYQTVDENIIGEFLIKSIKNNSNYFELNNIIEIYDEFLKDSFILKNYDKKQKIIRILKTHNTLYTDIIKVIKKYL